MPLRILAALPSVPYGNRNGRGDQITDVLKIDQHLVHGQSKEKGKLLKSHPAGLMKDVLSDVLALQTCARQQLSHEGRYLLLDKRQDAKAVHFDVADV